MGNRSVRPKRTRASAVGSSFRAASGRFNNSLIDEYEAERAKTHERTQDVLDITDATIAAEVAAETDFDQELEEFFTDTHVHVHAIGERAVFRVVKVVRPEVQPLTPFTEDEHDAFNETVGDVESEANMHTATLPEGEGLIKLQRDVEAYKLQARFEAEEEKYEGRPGYINVDEADVAISSRRKKGRARNWIKGRYHHFRARKYDYDRQPRGLRIAAALASVALAGIAFVSINADNVTYSEQVVPKWSPPTTQLTSEAAKVAAENVASVVVEAAQKIDIILRSTEFERLSHSDFGAFDAWAETQPAGTDLQAQLDNLAA